MIFSVWPRGPTLSYRMTTGTCASVTDDRKSLARIEPTAAISVRAALFLLLAAAAAPGAAEDYVTFRYEDIEVTAVPPGSFAVTLAHQLHRYAAALTQLLQIDAGQRLPTHVYVLSETGIEDLLQVKDGSAFLSDGHEVTVISPRGDDSTRTDGAYFGYARGLLNTARFRRYPFWYREGVPEVFANPEFTRETVTLGNFRSGYAYALQRGNWIPVQSLFGMQQGDPQLAAGSPTEAMFCAESWYVARYYFTEQKYRAEFTHYLQLMNEGTPEPQAFAQSFKITYEQLDLALQNAKYGPMHVYHLRVAEGAVNGNAVPLAPADMNSQLESLRTRLARGVKPP